MCDLHILTYPSLPSMTFRRWHSGGVVWAPDSKTGDPGFKSRSDYQLDFFPWFNISALLGLCQLVCLLPVSGIVKLLVVGFL